MRVGIYALITYLLLLQCSSPAIGQAANPAPAPAGAPTIAVAAPASDKTNYLGDKIKFQYTKFVSKVDMTTAEKTLSSACAPAFSTLRGIGTLKIGSNIQPAFIVTNVSDKPGCPSNTVVKVEDVVVVNQDDLDSTPPDRYGLTYGTLLVPYKYHLAGSKSFTGSTSVGGYLGFRQDRSGITGLALQYIAFLGASNVPVTQTSNGQSSTLDMFGVSYGLGILGTVKGDFHMGIVVGADRVNKNAGYENNGKGWVAVEIGYSFSN